MVEEGDATHKTITVYQRSLEIRRAQRGLTHLLALHNRDEKLPEGQDDEITEDSLTEAQEALTQLKATDVVALMLTTNAPPEVALVAHNRARRALYALAPVVAMRLADKVDSKYAPGSERILVEVAKGLGLLVPGAPLGTGERKEAVSERDLADLSDEELERRLNRERGADE